MEKTVCAISTPLGNGGISIVRMTGNESLNILQKLVSYDVNTLEPRKMKLSKINCDDFTESALVVYFKNPFSYTGEDMVEIQCHGGVFIANGILKKLISSGAKMAEAGEFTKRAFLNGKISLEQAEGVIDMINAENSSQVKAGYNLLNGKLNDKVKKYQSILTDSIAEMETALDYPEHDIEYSTKEKILDSLTKAKNGIDDLLKTATTGKIVKNGINLVIVGKPNVGKSSLLNSLLGYDRAIVSDEAGTTRDTVEESFNFGNLTFKITDTAGIRDTSNKVEKIGVERAKNLIDIADIVLCVLDSSNELEKEDEEILKSVEHKLVLYVYNKSDLKNKLAIKKTPSITISALKEENITELKQKLFDMVVDKNILNSSLLITNNRHEEALRNATESLKKAIQTLLDSDTDECFDLCILDVREAWLNLGEITGETSNEEIINTIFSKFCLGK